MSAEPVGFIECSTRNYEHIDTSATPYCRHEFKKKGKTIKRVTKYVGIRIPAELKDRIDKICRDEQRSLTSLCKIFLEKGVNTYDPSKNLVQGINTKLK